MDGKGVGAHEVIGWLVARALSCVGVGICGAKYARTVRWVMETKKKKAARRVCGWLASSSVSVHPRESRPGPLGSRGSNAFWHGLPSPSLLPSFRWANPPHPPLFFLLLSQPLGSLSQTHQRPHSILPSQTIGRREHVTPAASSPPLPFPLRGASRKRRNGPLTHTTPSPQPPPPKGTQVPPPAPPAPSTVPAWLPSAAPAEALALSPTHTSSSLPPPVAELTAALHHLPTHLAQQRPTTTASPPTLHCPCPHSHP